MRTLVDINNIQAFIIRANRLPLARYYFMRVHRDPDQDNNAETPELGVTTSKYLTAHNKNARRFIASVYGKITVGDDSSWQEIDLPNGKTVRLPRGGATTSIAFTYRGFEALSVPNETLIGFSEEFREGMHLRAHLLGDRGKSDPKYWDDVWKNDRVHIWISVNAMHKQDLDRRCTWLEKLVKASNGGISVENTQDASALVLDDVFSGKEHFGYTNGVSNPAYEGLCREHEITGRGKLLNGEWSPLATGELLLGYKDEGGEMPLAPLPHIFGRNGTYMVYRKLHQNVRSFRSYLSEWGAKYPGGKKMLAAKWVGRWPNGAPLMRFPDQEPDLSQYDAKELNDVLNNFTYFDKDEKGKICPLCAHTRRFNPRDALGLGGKLVNRRRISRRSIPYGKFVPEGAEHLSTDARGDHGLAVVILNADIARQFEFVQQQWIDYGNNFKLGNDKDIILGTNNGEGSAVIQGDPPFVCPKLPQFVECRGGDYFFIPSLTALRMIANRSINPI